MIKWKNYLKVPVDKGVLPYILTACFCAWLDLTITEYALKRGYYETRPFGNMPMIYYPWMIIFVVLIYWLEIKNESKYHTVTALFCALPLVAFIHNLLILWNG